MRYYIFSVDRYDPDTYHFMGDSMRDELVPQSREGEDEWTEVEADSPSSAIAAWVEYLEENVCQMGKSEWAAVPIGALYVETYEPPPAEGTIFIEDA